jgi:hypothetical protein
MIVIMQELASKVNKPERSQLALPPPDSWKTYCIAYEAHHEGTARWFSEETQTFSVNPQKFTGEFPSQKFRFG